jgi:hypothetical protein
MPHFSADLLDDADGLALLRNVLGSAEPARGRGFVPGPPLVVPPLPQNGRGALSRAGGRPSPARSRKIRPRRRSACPHS